MPRVVHDIDMHDKSKEGSKYYMIFCPACRHGHVFETPKWSFNGNYEKPTFRASYLQYGSEENRKKSNGRYGHRCHCFVTDGKIQFLNDCTHTFAGKTVNLEEF